ncbi:hypothetical protein L2E82_20967 [Cichorium intybus]|uniref:Uncharacterized protein n=1 Tax=Cichorium intybus TaxID=13427 RepID=A0ACB9DVJ5_CICIN|nr:hypothetical protein L2E82_20967 [Cichorium intybus]
MLLTSPLSMVGVVADNDVILPDGRVGRWWVVVLVVVAMDYIGGSVGHCGSNGGGRQQGPLRSSANANLCSSAVLQSRQWELRISVYLLSRFQLVQRLED